MPIRRGTRCVPPAPGIRPSVTSGNASRSPGSSTAMRRWQAKATSSPPPMAEPFKAATKGLPLVSMRRRHCPISRTRAAASAGVCTCRNSSRSPPEMKSVFADVMITPLTEEFSIAPATAPTNAAIAARFLMFTGEFGASQVMTEMPVAGSKAVSIIASHPLDQSCDAHAKARAHRRDTELLVLPVELICQRADQDRSRRADGVAQRNGAADRIHLAVRGARRLHEVKHDGSEGLVDLEQIHVAESETGAIEATLRRFRRRRQHDAGVGADLRHGANAGARFQAEVLTGGGGPDQHGGGAIGDAGGVAGVMHIIETIHLRIAMLDRGLEAGLSKPRKRRTQLRQPLDSR